MLTKGKPWEQKVLTKKEVEFIKCCYDKMEKAYKKCHKQGKCPIKAVGASAKVWYCVENACNRHIKLTKGVIEHYPNGYYV